MRRYTAKFNLPAAKTLTIKFKNLNCRRGRDLPTPSGRADKISRSLNFKCARHSRRATRACDERALKPGARRGSVLYMPNVIALVSSQALALSAASLKNPHVKRENKTDRDRVRSELGDAFGRACEQEIVRDRSARRHADDEDARA